MSNRDSATATPGEGNIASECARQTESAQSELDQPDARGRREFLGKSGRLMIYVPPLIQLFIPTKALAASPSS
ncbi:MAG: hypothetical protein GXP29_02205 [Planctomycetes bacterium]|nr:hypothetical protein [Planctomycetota bacterium]